MITIVFLERIPTYTAQVTVGDLLPGLIFQLHHVENPSAISHQGWLMRSSGLAANISNILVRMQELLGSPSMTRRKSICVVQNDTACTMLDSCRHLQKWCKFLPALRNGGLDSTPGPTSHTSVIWFYDLCQKTINLNQM